MIFEERQQARKWGPWFPAISDSFETFHYFLLLGAFLVYCGEGCFVFVDGIQLWTSSRNLSRSSRFSWSIACWPWRREIAALNMFATWRIEGETSGGNGGGLVLN
jgi:hypothetical protein